MARKKSTTPAPIPTPIPEPRSPGRPRGAECARTSISKAVITSLLSDYQETGQLSSDWQALDPYDRLVLFERLLQYILPRMQATSIDLTAETRLTIEDTLIALSQPPQN